MRVPLISNSIQPESWAVFSVKDSLPVTKFANDFTKSVHPQVWLNRERF
jgi:hypothetical protein